MSKKRTVFFYMKNKREFIEVEDVEINQSAKKKLDLIFSTYSVPNWIKEKWEDVYLCNNSGNVDKAKSLYIKSIDSTYDLTNKLNDLTSKEWLPETVTVFTQKGLGAGNKNAQIEKQHPAPFSYQDIMRLIKFYSKEDDKVLDPFSGVGSTVKACAFENRIGYGIELNSKYHELAIERINIEVPDEMKFKNNQNFINSDCISEVKKIESNFFDFIVTSPPYWNILETVDHKSNERLKDNLDVKYSDNIDDLGNISDYDEFIEILSTFFDDCSRILKKDRYMAIIVSDFRKKEKFHIFHADLANKIESKGNFKLKGIKILYQKHKSIYPYGYPYTFVPNIHHQNVLIFENKK
jgi:DNA modification methylase